MDSISIIHLDRINRIIRSFIACGEGPSAEGRIIPKILLILSNFLI